MSTKPNGPTQMKGKKHPPITTAGFTYNDTNVETGKTKVNRNFREIHPF
jgi:hypothetical protein